MVCGSSFLTLHTCCCKEADKGSGVITSSLALFWYGSGTHLLQPKLAVLKLDHASELPSRFVRLLLPTFRDSHSVGPG